ncbi:MAG: hypothetical protein IIB44_07185 [Candidatus Marinimicrobia bacterium]|nr:hypothetical protein [Candidatus Neomarinimicrobiota bacterium]
MSDCCSIPDTNTEKDELICPICGEKGRPVKAQTIRSLTKRDWENYHLIGNGFYCTNPGDSTVYYFSTMDAVVKKDDVVDRVGIKETEEPIFVCYCFRHTKSKIISDFKEHGYSTIEKEVRQKVNDKLCSCEVTNPSGRCCLGDIRKTFLPIKEEVVI